MVSSDLGGSARWSQAAVAGGFVAAAAGAVLAVAAWRSVQHVNTLWDEQTDLNIAAALVRDPLRGCGLDGSQTRLPMYVCAAAFAIFGESLETARAVSAVLAGVAVVATWWLGRRLFGEAEGVLAALLLAASPYFASCSRFAMTEADAYPALFNTLALGVMLPAARRATGRSAAAAAFSLALATGAKLFAIFLPAVMALLLWRHREAFPRGVTVRSTASRTAALGLLGLFAGAAAAAQMHYVAISIGLWGAGAAATAAVIVWFCCRGEAMRPAAWLMLVCLLAGAVFCSLLPEQVLQPEVLRATARRLVKWDRTTPFSGAVEALWLHASVLMVKSGWPIGVLSAAAVGWGLARSPRHPGAAAVAWTFALFFIAVLALPLRQVFYLMSVFPVLMVLVAGFVVTTARRLVRRDRVACGVWGAVVAGALAYGVFGLVDSYPDWSLYGYRDVGTQWLGRETRGYRNLVQTPNDGIIEALEWCRANVPRGKRVVSYFWADYVIEPWLAKPPPWELVRRWSEVDPNKGPPIDDADYLLLHVGNVVEYRDAPSAEQIAAHFDPTPVHVVYRGTGAYRMAFAWVYRKR